MRAKKIISTIISISIIIPLLSSFTTVSFAEDTTTYKIEADTESIEFGDVEADSEINEKNFVITNSGDTDTDFAYVATDPDNAFTITEGDFTLVAGENTIFSIMPNMENLSTGTHIASYEFTPTTGDENDTVIGFTLNASITVTEKEAPKVTGITIEPNSDTVVKGDTCRFKAIVAGTGEYDDSVTWSIANNKSENTNITAKEDNYGALYISEEETAPAITVIATSEADPTISSYATIVISENTVSLTVTVNNTAGGTVAGTGIFEKGSSPTVNAIANTGYTFSGWQQNGNTISTSSSYTVSNIQSDTTLVAVFAQATYTVTATPNKSKMGTVTGSGTVTHGGTITLKAEAEDGYDFVCWKENSTKLGTSKTLTLKNITSNRTITAEFEKAEYEVAVVITPDDSGKVTGDGEYEYGETVTLKATANSGYTFVGWIYKGDTVSTDTTYKIKKISKDMTLTAKFTKDTTYTIKASVSGGSGSITPSGDVKVESGGKQTFTIKPATGYKINKVLIDNKEYEAIDTYVFTNVSNNHTITVEFSEDTTTSKTTNGTTVNTTNTTTTTNNKNTATASATTSTSNTTTGSSTKKTASSSSVSKNNTASSNNSLADEEESEEVKKAKAEALAKKQQALQEKYDAYDELVKSKKAAEEEVVNTGLFSDEDITEAAARKTIENGEDLSLMSEAYAQGYLKINVYNSYAEQYENNFDGNYSMPKLGEVSSQLFSENEKIYILGGGTASINVSLRENDTFVSDYQKELISEGTEYSPAQYFDFSFSKAVNKEYTDITDLPENLTVTITIPNSIKKSANDEYAIIRLHNGQVEVLDDLDSEEGTLTFATDRFSQYAIGVKKGKRNISTTIIILAGMLIISILLGIKDVLSNARS